MIELPKRKYIVLLEDKSEGYLGLSPTENLTITILAGRDSDFSTFKTSYYNMKLEYDLLVSAFRAILYPAGGPDKVPYPINPKAYLISFSDGGWGG